MNLLKEMSKFKVGDYLIGFHPPGTKYSFKTHKYNEKKVPILDCNAAHKKYVVVYVDSLNIPYVRALNNDGGAIGKLWSPIAIENNIKKSNEIEFEIDPDFVDHVIMMDECNYNPVAINQEKSQLAAKIKKHNKDCKLTNITDDEEFLKFLKTIKVGDTLYTATKNSFKFLEINTIKMNKVYRKSIDKDFIFCKILTSNGKEKNLSPKYFFYKSLYTQCPRSYNELKI